MLGLDEVNGYQMILAGLLIKSLVFFVFVLHLSAFSSTAGGKGGFLLSSIWPGMDVYVLVTGFSWEVFDITAFCRPTLGPTFTNEAFTYLNFISLSCTNCVSMGR